MKLLPKMEATLRFFGLKTCDTCRKALKELAAAGIVPKVTDVRADGVAETDRAAILAAFGAGALNTRSTTWRALSDADRALDPAALLAAHPTLMKRPVIEAGGAWYQGWSPATKRALGVA